MTTKTHQKDMVRYASQITRTIPWLYRNLIQKSQPARTNAPTGRVDRNWTKPGGKAP